MAFLANEQMGKVSITQFTHLFMSELKRIKFSKYKYKYVCLIFPYIPY